MTTLIEDLAERPVVAVLRAASSHRFREAISVLHDSGIIAVEITMTTPGAVDSITRVRSDLPTGTLIGAGTVRTVEQVHQAVNAGAQFLVSQVTDARLISAAASLGVPFIPGALTPNEIVAAWNLGVEAVKISPVGPVGGLEYLTELVGPLPEVALFPTGGVMVNEAVHYLEAGATLIGLSRDLLRDSLVDGDLAALGARARAVVQQVDSRPSASSSLI